MRKTIALIAAIMMMSTAALAAIPWAKVDGLTDAQRQELRRELEDNADADGSCRILTIHASLTKAERDELLDYIGESEPTKTRGLVEFCDTYISRIHDFNNLYNEDLEGRSVYYSDPNDYVYDDQFMISHGAGTLIVDKADLRITEVGMTIWVDKDNDAKNFEALEKCMIAVSCLEEGYEDEEDHNFMYGVGYESMPFISTFFDTFRKQIMTPYSNSAPDLTVGGDEIVLYEGNYTYSIQLAQSMDRSYKFIRLNAKAR